MANATDKVGKAVVRWTDEFIKRSTKTLIAETNFFVHAMIGVGTDGYFAKFDDTASMVFAGVVVGEEGNPVIPAGTAGAEDLQLLIEQPRRMELAIASVAVTDIGKKVYALFDNSGTLDPGATTYANLVGHVVDVVGTSIALVELDYSMDRFGGGTESTTVVSFTGATAVNELQVPDNLADALSVRIAAGNDFIIADSTNTNEKLSIAAHASMKLGFFAVTPAVRASAYTQTYATADKTHANPTATALTHAAVGGTADGTLVDCTSSYSEAAVEENFKECATSINLLIADVADVKALVNSVIDDLQLYGLLA